MKNKFLIFASALLLYTADSLAQQFGQFIDVRDNQQYRTVEIGNQIWMAQNLNFDTTGCRCNKCETYGRLYSWHIAKNVCPSGWHLPSDAEWLTLINRLGGDSIAGGKLKSTEYWNSPNTGADNSSGFSALPGGYFGNDSVFYHLGHSGYWWTATEYYTDLAYYRYMAFYFKDISRDDYNKEVGFSVRCVKD